MLCKEHYRIYSKEYDSIDTKDIPRLLSSYSLAPDVIDIERYYTSSHHKDQDIIDSIQQDTSLPKGSYYLYTKDIEQSLKIQIDFYTRARGYNALNIYTIDTNNQYKISYHNNPLDNIPYPKGTTFLTTPNTPIPTYHTDERVKIFLKGSKTYKDFILNLKQKIDNLKIQGYEMERVRLEVGYGEDLQIAWGGHKNVSKEFKEKVIAICKRLEINPDYLMSCMALETVRTFSPSIKNPLATATGLIQFLKSTAISLGTTIEELAKMTQVEQLDYVEKYFRPYKGKIQNIEDIYMVIFYPMAVGKQNDYIISTKGNNVYNKNKGLDVNKDGILTKGEAGAVARQYLKEGLKKYKG